MWFIIGFIIGTPVAFFIGWYGRQMVEGIKKLLEREPEQDGAVVTPLPAGYVDVNNMSSGIISPKTPAQIDFEQEQRLNNLL